MAEVTWFKVLTDIFSDDKIKIIQSMPEGDSLLVMWFKVLAQAGKTNDGGYIYLKKDMPYTAGMLSTLFNKPQQIVEMALKTFSQFEMIDIDENGYIFVTKWEKHQSIDKLNQIKEKTKLRVQNHREKKKLELQQSNATVTLPKRPDNAIDIEVDLEVDKEKDTTTDEEDFKTVKTIYEQLHHVPEMPYNDCPMLTRMLADGITPELIIDVMKEKIKPGVKTIKYYVEAIRERHANPSVVPFKRLSKQEREMDILQRFKEGGA